ncbi:MAG: outer membrane protein assembly factor BamD [Acidobacteriota bacterium]
MTKHCTKIWFSGLILVFASVGVFAQGPVKGRVEPNRDPALEIEAKHNLDVAKYYITRRKAYAGGIERLEEIINTHPEFSRMDEVLFYLGEAHFKLNKFEKAEDFYNKLLRDYPESEYVKKTKEQVEKLKSTKEGKS